ncbi:phosphoribosyltransferase [Halobaculum lipolyticum]|uniref:Phosphoribosyltransferase n=1 Tax=Halobaculum lipolyticum TaxID=3032001 RepID=A0ABD5WB97_9EURY|nr:phosphoribosyltransferase family protein [Halobaculum sp. DT31]
MFENRTEAGERVADLVERRGVEADVVVSVPRGGLPVGRVVADRLGVPLDVVSARKIGAPWNEELAIGAVASDGSTWLNDDLIREAGVETAYLERTRRRERAAARDRVRRYREGRDAVDLAGKRVLLVDDGVATGATTLACLAALEAAGAASVVVAVPVAPADTLQQLSAAADEVLCVETPVVFGAVGRFYRSFDQVSDDEARSYLEPDPS